jgi:CheY-like chemotaxis protein
MNPIPHETEATAPSEPRSRHDSERIDAAGAAMPGTLSGNEPDIIEIRDPEIDVPDLMRRIRQNMAARQKLPPLAAALGRARMAEERQKLRKAILDLQERMDDLGIVDTHQTGWLAALDLAVKKLLRKLINRHLHQQQLVHERLVLVLDQVVRYLDDHDQCIRSSLDQAQRQRPEAASKPTPLS